MAVWGGKNLGCSEQVHYRNHPVRSNHKQSQPPCSRHESPFKMVVSHYLSKRARFISESGLHQGASTSGQWPPGEEAAPPNEYLRFADNCDMEVTSLINSVSQAVPLQSAYQNPPAQPPPSKSQPSTAPEDTVRLSAAAQAAKAISQELQETQAQTAQEAAKGDVQAKHLLAREAANRA